MKNGQTFVASRVYFFSTFSWENSQKSHVPLATGIKSCKITKWRMQDAAWVIYTNSSWHLEDRYCQVTLSQQTKSLIKKDSVPKLFNFQYFIKGNIYGKRKRRLFWSNDPQTPFGRVLKQKPIPIQHSAIWTNTFEIGRYIWLWQIHFAIWRNAFCNLKKCILQLGQIHFVQMILRHDLAEFQKWRLIHLQTIERHFGKSLEVQKIRQKLLNLFWRNFSAETWWS